MVEWIKKCQIDGSIVDVGFSEKSVTGRQDVYFICRGERHTEVHYSDGRVESGRNLVRTREELARESPKTYTLEELRAMGKIKTIEDLKREGLTFD